MLVKWATGRPSEALKCNPNFNKFIRNSHSDGILVNSACSVTGVEVFTMYTNVWTVGSKSGQSAWHFTQSHPTTGPVRYLSPVRFLARKAEWSARRNFTSVLFSWSHRATGPVRLDTAVHLWFGRMIRRTPRVPRAMPVRASYGPRTGIFNVFHILRDPYGDR